MTRYIAIQNTYTHVEVGLYDGNTKKAAIECTNKAASKELIPRIIELLNQTQTRLEDYCYIAVNQGPGPFTTLRVVLATVNGISFACKIPLLGVDGLYAFLDAYQSPAFPITIALLNAFNQEVYYGIQDYNLPYKTGYDHIDRFLDTIRHTYNQHSIRFIGNGSILYKEKITDVLSSQAIFPDDIPEASSLDAIAHNAYTAWNKDTPYVTNQLLPLYLKKHAVERSDLSFNFSS